ncbi:DUF2147 domain-containing protein [uncultured Tateyamaria sp.]|uniref:DUF2147 domain-containing protein n=1 Tax=Tateyamaria sp. 1078 TaxID=3417464 RepID=UPI002616EA60|nr:DUF2147 domain-containing protein [uncultured Tateyamaria sp.]
MKLHHTLAALLAGALSLGTSAALAAGPEGIWRTEPDRKGQVAHVKSTRCGSGYCGTIVEVFGPSGAPVAAPTVGKRVFWDMTGSGSVYEGQAFVPAHNRTYAGKMQVQGNRMKVSGCLGPVCQSQTWKRVR